MCLGLQIEVFFIREKVWFCLTYLFRNCLRVFISYMNVYLCRSISWFRAKTQFRGRFRGRKYAKLVLTIEVKVLCSFLGFIFFFLMSLKVSFVWFSEIKGICSLEVRLMWLGIFRTGVSKIRAFLDFEINMVFNVGFREERDFKWFLRIFRLGL